MKANFLDPDFLVKPNLKSGSEVKGDSYDDFYDDDEDYDDYDY